MSREDKITLISSLELSIKCISDNFSGDWLIAGNQTDSGLADGRYSESYPMDYHPFLEVCVCVSGCFAMRISNNIYEIKEGSTCIIFPGLKHSESYAKDMDHLAIWLAFDSNIIRVHLSGNRKHEFYTSDLRTLVSDHEYSAIINNINLERMNNKSFSDTLLKLHILHILIITLNKISIDLSKDIESGVFKKKIVEEVKEFIEANGFRYIHLRDISQGLYISAGYLNNIFKSVTGITIMQYVENRRIERAMYLLKNTDESIGNISQQLGYYDQYHFSKSFKKATKDSPAQYRKAAWEFPGSSFEKQG